MFCRNAILSTAGVIGCGTPYVRRKGVGPPHGENLIDEGMGFPGGVVEQIFASHPTSALLIHSRERCTAYRFPPAPTAERRRSSVVRPDSHAARGAAIASLFDRCSLTVSTCPPTPMEKFCLAARTHNTSVPLSSARAAPTSCIQQAHKSTGKSGNNERVYLPTVSKQTSLEVPR
jgi:hypothetical protein